MDFVINWNLLTAFTEARLRQRCLRRRGVEQHRRISSKSVAVGSVPVAIPDFTRGLWRDLPPLAIAEKTASAS